jgi:hypothetical protein
MPCSPGPASWPASRPAPPRGDATVPPVSHFRSVLILLAAASLFVAACGDDGPDDYSDSTREAFMTGCVEDDTDEDLVEVCECTYDTAVEELPFEEFKTVEQRLQSGGSDIPDAVSDIILDCIRQVSASRS